MGTMFAAPRLARGVVMAWTLTLAAAAPGAAAPDIGANTPEQAKQWRALADLPDWSGVWAPDIADQRRQERANAPPWTPKVQTQIDQMWKDFAIGKPFLVFYGCFPHGMPSWMLITHNAMEILFTPGRVTMLGEVDGNRMRRIYTDGRGHPEDPDPTMHGHSIGHWDGDALVVDTVGVAPQAFIAITESVGVPNNGAMHIVERIRLRDKDTLEDVLTITAPKVLTKPWTTTRLYTRFRGPQYDLVEGQCVRGDYEEGTDANGNSIFKPLPPRVNGGLAPR
jgi:hypothetical protein